MPQKYQYALNNPDEVERITSEYFEECKNALTDPAQRIILKSGDVKSYGSRPTIPALALRLGVSSKTIERYAAEGAENERKHFDSVDAARNALLPSGDTVGALPGSSSPSISPAPDGGKGGDYRGGMGGASPLSDSLPQNITMINNDFSSFLSPVVFPSPLSAVDSAIDAHRAVCLTLSRAVQTIEDVYLQQGMTGLIDARLAALVLSRWGYGTKTEIDTTVRIVVEGLTPDQLTSLGR